MRTESRSPRTMIARMRAISAMDAARDTKKKNGPLDERTAPADERERREDAKILKILQADD